MKRFVLSLFSALLAALLLTPYAAFAGEQTGGSVLSDWGYTLDDEQNAVLLTKYVGSASSVTVPAKFEENGKEYRTLLACNTVFRANTTVRSVKICGGVGFSNGSMRLLFSECTALTDVDLSEVDTSDVVDMSYMFYNCTALKSVDLSPLTTGNVTTLRGFFSGCSALKSADFSSFDTPEVTDMSYMFYDCGALQSLDLSDFETGSVTEIRAIFSGCTRLSSLTGYENWDTSSLKNMSFSFNGFAKSVSASVRVVIDLSRWDLSNINNSGWCFQNCRAQQILLPDNLAVISAGFLNHATRYEGESFTVPSGVKKIGYAHTLYDFATNDLTEIRVADGNTHYKAVDGILYSADGKEMLAVPRNKPFENGVFDIPEGVDFLGELSFSRNYNIHTVILPDTLEIKYVPVYDDRYIVFEDTGNLNAGTNLSIAIYCYTGITDYAVKETNPRYRSVDGIIYSKDMTRVISVPARYGRIMDIPEGVEYWDREAMWDAGSTVDNLLANCSGVVIPSTMKKIEDGQLAMLNRLYVNRKNTSNPFTIEVAGGNTAYRLGDDGTLRYAITITSQPCDVSADIGETAATGFTAEGEGLRYQWYGRDPGQESFWKSGLKGDTYSVAMVPKKSGRQVYCVITDKYGNKLTTDTVTLSIAVPEEYELKIEKQPQSVYVDVNETAVTSVSVEGDGLKYQWYGRDPGQESFWKSGLTGDTYSVAMVPKKSGREVYCVITDKYGNKVTTDTVTLNMAVPEGYELKITKQPENVCVGLNETAVTTVSVEGEGLKYQWYGRDPGQSSFWKSGLTGDTYSVLMVPKKSGREVYCVITDKYGNKVTTQTVTLNAADL